MILSISLGDVIEAVVVAAVLALLILSALVCGFSAAVRWISGAPSIDDDFESWEPGGNEGEGNVSRPVRERPPSGGRVSPRG